MQQQQQHNNHPHHNHHIQQQQQQQQQQRSTFYRANRPGNLMIVDESIIENITPTVQDQAYLSASSSTTPSQFSLQQQQQQQFTNPVNTNNATYSMPVQQTQMPYKMHTTNNNQAYLQTQSVSSPQPYMNTNTAQSPRMVPHQQQQQHNIVPNSPSYASYPSSYTPNRTINAQSNNNNNTNNPSPFINPPPPPPPLPTPLQYNTPVISTTPSAVPPNTAYESFTPKYSPCLTSAHMVSNSKTYFNFDLPNLNSMSCVNGNVPQSPTQQSNYIKMNQSSSQMRPMTQNNYQMFNSNTNNNNNNNVSSTNNTNGGNQSNYTLNYQKMPHTPLTAVPFNTHHHQNNDINSLSHSLSVPSSPYNFNQQNNQQPAFQFNTAMIKTQLQSIQEDSTPSVVRFSNNISINNEISQTKNIGINRI